MIRAANCHAWSRRYMVLCLISRRSLVLFSSHFWRGLPSGQNAADWRWLWHTKLYNCDVLHGPFWFQNVNSISAACHRKWKWKNRVVVTGCKNLMSKLNIQRFSYLQRNLVGKNNIYFTITCIDVCSVAFSFLFFQHQHQSSHWNMVYVCVGVCVQPHPWNCARSSSHHSIRGICLKLK